MHRMQKRSTPDETCSDKENGTHPRRYRSELPDFPTRIGFAYLDWARTFDHDSHGRTWLDLGFYQVFCIRCGFVDNYWVARHFLKEEGFELLDEFQHTCPLICERG